MSLSVTIKKKYEDFDLGVDFSTESKKIGILGASGSGKSLTLKAIAGLVKPEEGRISFDGRTLFDSAEKTDISADRRRVGYLFQDYALFPHMTVEKNIRTALDGARRIEKLEHGSGANPGNALLRQKNPENTIFQPKDTEDVLREFGLWELKDHRPGELSGGQKQRTALARMLVTNPQLLLLDEPFSALDTFLREGMRMELTKLLEEYQRSVVIVSHDRDEIYQLCDYLVLLDRGKMIGHGDTEKLFEQPGNVAAARLTGCKNISRIQKTGENTFLALDWGGIELLTEQKISEEISYAGIRAHDFIPGKTGVNDIPVGNATIRKLPFEWYVMPENGLWWKIPKAMDDQSPENLIPSHLSIPPNKIVLLRK